MGELAFGPVVSTQPVIYPIARSQDYVIGMTTSGPILEGSAPGKSEASGISMSFTVLKTAGVGSFYWEITGITGQTSDFWQPNFPGSMDGAPFAGRAVSGSSNFGAYFLVTLNADNIIEPDESFLLSIYSSAEEASAGAGPLISGTFHITDDDTSGLGNIYRDGVSSWEVFAAYTGPVSFLQFQYLGTASNEIVSGSEFNDFLNLLGGDDAANGGAGNDVLDGGNGSNFLIGGAGLDVFFIDGRGRQTTWSTIADWQYGEQVSIWGWQPGVSTMRWVDLAGTGSYQGRTLHADLDGNGVIDTSVTWSHLQGRPVTPKEFDGLLWFS